MLKGKKNQELDIRAFPEHILMEQGNEAGISHLILLHLTTDSLKLPCGSLVNHLLAMQETWL